MQIIVYPNLIYKFTTSVCACVCLTRQFCILIRRQNRGAAFSMAEPTSVTFWRCWSWWRRDTRQRGPETQVLRAKCKNTRVVKTRRQQQKKRAVSLYRGPETQVLRAKYRGPETQGLRAKAKYRGPEAQVLRAKCSNTRGLETQVLRAKCSNTRHGRIVSDRHGYPLVCSKVSLGMPMGWGQK
jgi:hypothetical protein